MFGGAKKKTGPFKQKSSKQPAATDVRQTAPNENAVTIVAEVGDTMRKGISRTPRFILLLVDFLWAVLVLALIFLVLYIAFYLIYYYHPQFFFICHWTGFDTYMKSYYTDLKDHVERLRSFSAATPIQKKYFELAGYDLRGDIDSVVGGGLLNTVSSLSDEELVLIFRFWNSLKNPKGMLQGMDLGLIENDKYLEDGEIDPDKAELKDLVDKAAKVRELRENMKKLKETLQSKENSRNGSGIIGSLDPQKLYWMKLMIEGMVELDTTLLHYSKTIGNLDANGNFWAMHVQLGGTCDKRPLESNERIFLEIKRFLGKCENKNSVLEYINLVLDPPDSYKNALGIDTSVEVEEEKASALPSVDVNAAVDLLGSAVASSMGVKGDTSLPRIKQNAYSETRAIFDTIMAIYELDIMLNYYLYDIRLGYETRKSGYRLNFVLFTYYWWPYAQWIFVVKIKQQIWEKFPDDFKNSALSFLEFWVTLPEALAKLPLTLAGEGFEQQGDSNFPVLNYINNIISPFVPRHVVTELAKEPDTVEHFGFLKGLLSIGKFFMAIIGVAMGLVFVITEPLKFIMMIIGFFLALSLMVVYILITVIGLHYVIAGIWAVAVVLIPAVFFTVFYTLMIVPISFMYTIMWVLDMLLGGLIMALLRCENIPSKWYKYSAYAYGNRFQRMLMCSYRCADRYEPDTAFVFYMCKRAESIKPTFCPHQNLFKLYKGESLSEPSVFRDYEVNTTTAMMNDDERRSYLEKTSRVRQRFNDTCRDCYQSDFLLTDGNSMDPEGANYTHIPRFICKFASQVCGTDDPKKYAQVCELCDNLYGTDIPMYNDGFKYSLNNTGDAQSEEFKNNKVDDPSRDPYIKGLVMLIICVAVVSLTVYLVKSYGKFDFGMKNSNP